MRRPAPPMLHRSVALLAVLALAAGCGAQRDEDTGQSPSGASDSSAEKKAGDVTIDMKNIKYLPAAAKAKVGDTIVWTNSDAVAHTVTKRGGPGPGFDSGTIPPGGTYELTVEQAGKIDYVCTIHPNQTGSLTVQ